jgi:hypothetical protein
MGWPFTKKVSPYDYNKRAEIRRLMKQEEKRAEMEEYEKWYRLNQKKLREQKEQKQYIQLPRQQPQAPQPRPYTKIYPIIRRESIGKKNIVPIEESGFMGVSNPYGPVMHSGPSQYTLNPIYDNWGNPIQRREMIHSRFSEKQKKQKKQKKKGKKEKKNKKSIRKSQTLL